jgi:predicted ester cyclase
MIAEDDKVVIRYSAYSACGTNTGELAGMPPSGERVAVTGFDMFRIANDRIVERWHCDDYFSLLQQLGMLPRLNHGG